MASINDAINKMSGKKYLFTITDSDDNIEKSAKKIRDALTSLNVKWEEEFKEDSFGGDYYVHGAIQAIDWWVDYITFIFYDKTAYDKLISMIPEIDASSAYEEI